MGKEKEGEAAWPVRSTGANKACARYGPICPGGFVDEKMTLATFLDAFHSKFKAMDIMSTYHGDKNCFITGYLSCGDKDLEIYMDLFYRGDFIYRVRKNPSGKPDGFFCGMGSWKNVFIL